MIGRSLYVLIKLATAPDSDINQTTGSGGTLSMWENRYMHATVCPLRAGQPKRTGDAAKSGQFIGQLFSWVTGDPIVVIGLSAPQSPLTLQIPTLNPTDSFDKNQRVIFVTTHAVTNHQWRVEDFIKGANILWLLKNSRTKGDKRMFLFYFPYSQNSFCWLKGKGHATIPSPNTPLTIFQFIIQLSNPSTINLEKLQLLQNNIIFWSPGSNV